MQIDSGNFAGGMMAILVIYCVITITLLAIAFWLEDRKYKREEGSGKNDK